MPSPTTADEEHVVTSKDRFSDDEWTRLKRAPFVAGMAISLADPGGPIEALKETSATLKTVLRAAETGSTGELVHDLASEVAADARQRKNPLAGFKPRGGTAGVEIVDELREVNRIVLEKASPEEAATFREWLLEAAREAADAAKEGGFLGFKAERVSEGEERMLRELAHALAAPDA
jgi:broad specificity phosphatase PhoE